MPFTLCLQTVFFATATAQCLVSHLLITDYTKMKNGWQPFISTTVDFGGDFINLMTDVGNVTVALSSLFHMNEHKLFKIPVL